MNKLRYIVTAFVLLAAGITAEAQNGLNIPFSQYGIGYSSMPNNVPSLMRMGGVAYTRSASNWVNWMNPASYSAIEKETFVFDMGLGIDMVTLTDPGCSVYDAEGNISYIAVAFPLTKWWKTSLGMLPLSDVNYESVYTDEANSVCTRYEGTGGVAQFYWGHGFNVTKHLSLGANINYLYGDVLKGITYDFIGNDTTFFMDSRRLKETFVRNFTYDFGLQYSHSVGEKHSFTLGVTFKPEQTLRVSDNALVYTFVANGATEYTRDTIFPGPGQTSDYQSTLIQPMTMGVGLGFQKVDRWNLAADVTYAPWSGMKYIENDNHNLFGRSALCYGDNYRYALGFEWLGDKTSSHYFQRIVFSGGIHYETGRLQVLDAADQLWQIDEYGAGLGAAFPMRKGRSVLNVTVGYSSMGSVDILRRNCFTFGISVGSCESWFVKRKYN